MSDEGDPAASTLDREEERLRLLRGAGVHLGRDDRPDSLGDLLDLPEDKRRGAGTPQLLRAGTREEPVLRRQEKPPPPDFPPRAGAVAARRPRESGDRHRLPHHARRAENRHRRGHRPGTAQGPRGAGAR